MYCFEHDESLNVRLSMVHVSSSLPVEKLDFLTRPYSALIYCECDKNRRELVDVTWLRIMSKALVNYLHSIRKLRTNSGASLHYRSPKSTMKINCTNFLHLNVHFSEKAKYRFRIPYQLQAILPRKLYFLTN